MHVTRVSGLVAYKHPHNRRVIIRIVDCLKRKDPAYIFFTTFGVKELQYKSCFRFRGSSLSVLHLRWLYNRPYVGYITINSIRTARLSFLIGYIMHRIFLNYYKKHFFGLIFLYI